MRVLLPFVLLAAGACFAETVVAYVALDEMYSRPILDAFEAAAGVEVEAVYDTEAAKTTGLVNRLLAERNRPRADVFWNNEVAQTVVLKDAGALDAYMSPAASAIPARFKDADGYWTGFAARARVIIYNTDLVTDPPKSIRALLDPAWAGKAAIAKPLFGTTATHAAALFAAWGREEAEGFFLGLLKNDIAVLAGNATVRDQVARGAYAWGLTDTDDANGAVEDGLPAKWLLPDQEDDGIGTLVIPNSVALVKGGPNPAGGKALIDYLLSPAVEKRLAELRSMQIPLNPAVEAPDRVPKLPSIRTMDVPFEAMAAEMPESVAFIREEFLK
jgi:iron(III) transport system substrate-binding protein